MHPSITSAIVIPTFYIHIPDGRGLTLAVVHHARYAEKSET